MPRPAAPATTDDLLFRSMRPAADGRPLVAPSARGLGVRSDQVSGVFHYDLALDPVSGLVLPGTGGLSVAPADPARLPRHRRPPSLGGAGGDPVFAIARLALGPDLAYRPDPERPTRHGFIEPARPMSLDEFQAALAATRPRWVVYHPSPCEESCPVITVSPASIDDLVTTSLGAPQPAAEVRGALRGLLAAGYDRARLADDLSRLHRAFDDAGREREAEIIFDALDALAGWCAPGQAL